MNENFLSRVKYAVFALGNSEYGDDYCKVTVTVRVRGRVTVRVMGQG